VSRLGGFTRPFSGLLFRLKLERPRLFVITGQAVTSRSHSPPILMGWWSVQRKANNKNRRRLSCCLLNRKPKATKIVPGLHVTCVFGSLMVACSWRFTGFLTNSPDLSRFGPCLLRRGPGRSFSASYSFSPPPCPIRIFGRIKHKEATCP
jgi:hypothetical protein